MLIIQARLLGEDFKFITKDPLKETYLENYQKRLITLSFAEPK